VQEELVVVELVGLPAEETQRRELQARQTLAVVVVAADTAIHQQNLPVVALAARALSFSVIRR
jgi:hypothetical protein